MKHYTKNSVIFSVVLFAVAGFVYASASKSIVLAPVDQPNTPEQISKSSAEVVATNTAQPKNDTSDKSETKTNKQQDVRSLSAAKSQRTKQVAPKQATIAESVQKEKRYYLLSEPNDPRYSTGGYHNLVNARAAWDVTTGSADVLVAVIDGGFALNHEDLRNQWYTNAGESGSGKETDGIDNDNNGYVDDYRGWDFVVADNVPQAGSVLPDGDGVSHGTEVAGLVGAEGNNSLGSSALSWNTTLLPLQVIDDYGSGYSSDIAAAIYYAVDVGADIINMSLGTIGDDPVVRQAVDYAFAHNVLVVAAAGNCGVNADLLCDGQQDGYIVFPANYNRVIAVGAITSASQRATFSSYGQRLDMVAPGSGAIVSPTWSETNQSTSYATSLYGTSYASPIVASAAALLRSIRPDSTIDDIRALLMASTSKPDAMNGYFYTNRLGHGTLDIGSSLQIATALNGAEEVQPTLSQIGGASSERLFKPNTLLGSRCEVTPGAWCAIWLRSSEKNYERFLPYSQANDEAGASWSWNANALEHGLWEIYARQGDTLSNSGTTLLNK